MSAALIEQFDLLATSTGGIAKLRELILSLAVRGQLVPQDPSDEPASELLKKIRTEKDRLIAEGKIKRDKPLAEIGENEKPYELPVGWEWARFGEVILASDAGWSPSCDSIPREGDRWGVLKVSAVTWGEFRPDENKALPDHLDPRPECEVQAGDFLLSRANTEELVARSVVAWNPPARLMLSDKLIRLRLSGLIDKKLFCFINNSVDSRPHYIANASGTSSSMKNVSREVILTLPVPVPPASEQSRIVAKVEELMALCDRLEAEQDHAARVQGHWVEAALDQLAESADADEFRRHWQHLAEHFDTLFTTPASIDRLNATLLQLAVRGKLVAQDPSDEPASELLKQIRTEKDRLIAEGKIKRDKPLPPISEAEKPYALPEGWEWMRFGDYCHELCTGPFGSMIHKEDYVSGGIPLINPSHMIGGRIQPDIDISLPFEKASNFSAYRLSVGDIVLARRGEVGRYALVTASEDGWLCGTGSFFVKFSPKLSRAFMGLMFLSNDVRTYLQGESVGTTMVNLNQKMLLEMPIGIPPLAEQSRIVAQVEKLLTLTAELKARLSAAQTKQAHLTETLIAEVC